jgi:FixJ family two-component response regulator
MKGANKMALTVEQRNARRQFVEVYGTDQRNVVSYIVHGWDSHRISEKLDIPLMSVAATRANVTRGTYYPFVEGSILDGFQGTCNF